MQRIKVGIIGLGRSGRDIHGQYLNTAKDKYEIVAACDILPDRRERAAKEYGCAVYADYREMFARKDFDLLVNALPSHLHVPVTKQILSAGFNVLCDKPLAKKVKDVDMLIALAQKSGKVFAIYQQSRFAPYFQQIKKIIKSGVLGRIVQISSIWNGFSRRWDWQTLQEYNGGNLLNTGPHPLDQALNLLNADKTPEVTCIMDRVNTYGDAEDYVKLLLRAPGKPLVDLEISSCCAYPGFTYNIQASRGGVQGDNFHLAWKYFKPAEATKRRLQRTPIMNPNGTPSYCIDDLKWHEESWDLPEEQKDLFMTMNKFFYNMLHRTLTQGKPLEITPQQIRQQIAVIEECHRQNKLK
ncbi:MAG: Gfo/Idh/MocA family oxidoreductase [Candidatus Omnitrophica bacterium]|nr:Gfo/Idh/MocA family oxidoreductase [Candidatus Omnitrophota bacterium]